MYGEIDLELYTISMIRLNTAFKKLDDDGEADENILSMISDSSTDFEALLNDIVNDLNQKKINYNEYDPFFENISQLFPSYIIKLNEYLKNDTLKEKINTLIKIFNKILKTSDEYFKMRGQLQWKKN